jgi:hypothetical protein
VHSAAYPRTLPSERRCPLSIVNRWPSVEVRQQMLPDENVRDRRPPNLGSRRAGLILCGVAGGARRQHHLDRR